MRKEVHYIIGFHVAVVLFLVYCTFDLITLLHDDSFVDALLDADINPPAGTNKPELIPRIIHQTYKTAEIPEIWKAGQQACKDLHPDYQYILWTDELARDFIAKEYPWFLPTWDAYPYPIERADAIRYFVLSHYGGVYIDLDDGCNRKLDPLLTVPAFVRKTIPTGISNDVMGSMPKHPFFLKVIENLGPYQKNWLVPYITIMYSTGPLFLSVMWKQYKRWGVPAEGVVRILQPADYKGNLFSFFLIAPGSSWHLDDAKFIKSLSRHIALTVFVGFCVAFVVFYLEYLFYCWVISSHFRRTMRKVAQIVSCGYYRLSLVEDEEPRPIARRTRSNLPQKKRGRKDSNLPIRLDTLDFNQDASEKRPMLAHSSNMSSPGFENFRDVEFEAGFNEEEEHWLRDISNSSTPSPVSSVPGSSDENR
ncbi:glycosyltransferase family 32 protein [Babjeviella inositovora NRRL Y-12698]|uniref:inositol phosphorylceramide mannosyltransferase n=1 Tax=Babjeviella inositovora NRRL Y-12698 TaxID=984486 RepID=A0A1E3QQ43_9ASCO|nr:glycosyltransferase family 32 protein [Babjeviella inositovora NRRL Y-12698]ODQ79781.1 glycosyltransferase family 32 protein [Babjeviella inositovora NRRL Y-12698]